MIKSILKIVTSLQNVSRKNGHGTEIRSYNHLLHKHPNGLKNATKRYSKRTTHITNMRWLGLQKETVIR